MQACATSPDRAGTGLHLMLAAAGTESLILGGAAVVAAAALLLYARWARGKG
jgi:hypothetical protein